MTQDGTSHYMKGLVLLLCYVVIAACFFVLRTPQGEYYFPFFIYVILKIILKNKKALAFVNIYEAKNLKSKLDKYFLEQIYLT